MTAQAAGARRKMQGLKSCNLLAFLLLVFCTLPVAAQGPRDYADLYEQVSKSVVDIRAEGGGGTGTIISSDGHILTNAHVIYDYDYDEVISPIQVHLLDGREAEAEVVGYDHYSDIALLKIEIEEKLPAVKIGDSDKLRIGNAALAIGHPTHAHSYVYSLTSGLISSLDRLLPGPNYEVPAVCEVRWLQTDAAINGGNSGGPLLNTEGEIIGVISWGDSYGEDSDNVGLNFALPINLAMEIQREILDAGTVDWGILGVYLDHDLAYVTDAKGQDVDGLVVNQVNKGSGAEAAGIKARDVIIEYNGEKVNDLYFECVRAGTEIPIKLIREGEEMNFLVTVGAIGDEGFLALLD